jgi:hypothetical protein
MVTGNLSLNGGTAFIPFSKLKQSAKSGDKLIYPDGSSWGWEVGATLGLSPSYSQTYEY